jgi:ABC-type Mn2+/Zn2+ transport system ATPase subunit
LDVKPGELIMIVGTVGSGKSSIFKSLLGEMHVTRGTVTSKGKIAYFSQESFLINDIF